MDNIDDEAHCYVHVHARIFDETTMELARTTLTQKNAAVAAVPARNMLTRTLIASKRETQPVHVSCLARNAS